MNDRWEHDKWEGVRWEIGCDRWEGHDRRGDTREGCEKDGNDKSVMRAHPHPNYYTVQHHCGCF